MPRQPIRAINSCTRLPARFSRAWHRLHGFALISDWFSALFECCDWRRKSTFITPTLIGCRGIQLYYKKIYKTTGSSLHSRCLYSWMSRPNFIQLPVSNKVLVKLSFLENNYTCNKAHKKKIIIKPITMSCSCNFR